MREVRARIGTARLLLDGLSGASHVVASQTQSAALVATIKQQSSISLDERAALQVLVAEVRWAADDLTKVMLALQQDEKARQPMQNYQSMPEFFTAEDWFAMLDAKQPLAAIRDVVFSRAVALGLRCPSEQTLKWFTSFVIVLSEPSPIQMPANQKHDLMIYVKNAFKQHVRRVKQPVVYVTELPASPQQLKQCSPSLYAEAYGRGESPVPCKIDLKIVSSVDVGYRCRGSRGSVPSALLRSSSSSLSFDQASISQLANGIWETWHRCSKLNSRCPSL